MLSRLIVMSRFCYRPSFGLLLIRVVTGLIFIHHGLMKFTNVDGTLGFMGGLGIPAPLAYLAMTVEVLGGLMLVFGFMTRAAGVATGIVALVAALDAVIPMKGVLGAEFELLLAAVSFGLAFIGSGRMRVFDVFEHDEFSTSDDGTIP